MVIWVLVSNTPSFFFFSLFADDLAKQVDYVERGNLATVLEEGPQLQWKDQKFDMCLDIAKGMAYLHRYQ